MPDETREYDMRSARERFQLAKPIGQQPDRRFERTPVDGEQRQRVHASVSTPACPGEADFGGKRRLDARCEGERREPAAEPRGCARARGVLGESGKAETHPRGAGG